MKSKRLALILLSALILSACTGGGDTEVTTASDNGGIEMIEGVAIVAPRTEFNDSLDLTPLPVAGVLSQEYTITAEFEDGVLSGNAAVNTDIAGFSGTGTVYPIESAEDTVALTMEIPESGLYDINIRSLCVVGSEKGNYLYVDGEEVGIFSQGADEYSDSYIRSVSLEAGEHSFEVRYGGGGVLMDSITLTNAESLDGVSFEVSGELSNPNASDSAKRLMSFLADIYGSYSLTGQYGDEGRTSPEIERVYELTDKLPAVLGLDLVEYTPSRVEHGSEGRSVEYAIDWYYNHGGIVQFCWHWNAPDEYLLNNDDQPWYRGFYKEATNISLTKIMSGEDSAGYDLLIRDIDAIAEQLKRLQNADVPILWRPLHEASGGWFWWGNCSADTYKQLWNLMYDRLTNYHGLNNLIWVWNGEDAEWYPGDETVDIVSVDIYAGEKVYTSQSDRFYEAMDYSDSPKMVAMSENGCLVDPDAAFEENARWLFYGVWNGEFVINNVRRLSEQYNEEYMWEKVYSHERMLTLDELPNIREYPID